MVWLTWRRQHCAQALVTVALLAGAALLLVLDEVPMDVAVSGAHGLTVPADAMITPSTQPADRRSRV